MALQLNYSHARAKMAPGWLSYGCVRAILGPTSSTLEAIMVIHFRHCQKPSKNTPPKRSPQCPCSRARINAATIPKHKYSSKRLSALALQARRNEKSSKHVPQKRSPQWPCSPTIAAHARRKKNSKASGIAAELKSPNSTPCTDKRCGRSFEKDL